MPVFNITPKSFVKRSGDSTKGSLSLTKGLEAVDGASYIQDTDDRTKQIKIQVSGLTTGTTRTWTSQDKSGTVAYVGDDIGTPAPAPAINITNVSITNSTIGLTSLPIHDHVYHYPVTSMYGNVSGASTTPVGNITGRTYVGFVVTPSASAQMTHCEFSVAPVLSPITNLRAKIFATTGATPAPTGAALVTSAIIQARDIPSGQSTLTFQFPNSTGSWLTSGINYFIALETIGTVDAANFYNLYYDNATAPSNQYNSPDGSTWTVAGTNRAALMAVFYGNYIFTGVAFDQFVYGNGILPIQNLGTGTLTPGAVLTAPASGNAAVWSTALVATAFELNGSTITATPVASYDIGNLVPYTGATSALALGTQNLTQTTGSITSRTINIGNGNNAFSVSLLAPDTTSARSVDFGDYAGRVLLNSQVILASENASTITYTASADVTQIYITYAGAVTLTIPSGLPNNKTYIITNYSGGGAIITPSGIETIQGGAGWGGGAPFDSVIITKQGTDWRIVSEYDLNIAVAKGGTGATTAADARTNLGLAIGTNVQAYNAELTAIAGLSSADGNIIVGSATGWVAESGATARTSLGLGTIATYASGDYALVNQTMYIGTTQVAINRGSGALTLAGLTLTTPNIGTPSAGVLSSCSAYPIAKMGFSYNTEESTQMGVDTNDGTSSTTRYYNYFTLPSTYPFYKITAIEWKNGNSSTGNIIAGVDVIDANPPVSNNCIVMALTASTAQGTANAVQKVNVLWSYILPAGTICGAWHATNNAGTKFRYGTGSNVKHSRAYTFSANPPVFDSTAWDAANTVSVMLKVYYQGMLNASV